MRGNGSARRVCRRLGHAACLIAVLVSAPARSEVTWYFPPDKTVLTGAGLLHVVLEVRGEDEAPLKVFMDDLQVQGDLKSVPAKKGTFFHYAVQLHAGLNKLRAAWPGGREERELFYTPSLERVPRIPDGFTPLVFHARHGPGNTCADCHELQPKPEDRKPSSPSESSCYACHFRIVAFSSVHGPAARWSCTYCHKPESDSEAYSATGPVESGLCFRCHKELKASFVKGPYQHGPTSTGHCTICHNPHASDNQFELKKPAWDLCTSCHTRNASGRHIIAWGPTGRTHPTRGKPDPVRPHRELACPSCHNPHAAPSPLLWQFEATDYVQLCVTCHRM